MSRRVDENGYTVRDDALIEEEEVIEAVRKIQAYCRSANCSEECIFHEGNICTTASCIDLWSIPSCKLFNRPSDERKGEGWSTISVDENVGSNEAISAADAIVKMGEAFDLFAKATADMLRNKE